MTGARHERQFWERAAREVERGSSVCEVATSGEMSSPSRLLVDRSAGLAGDPSVTWHMPEHPGTSRIWVTLNDQRGGADWAFFDVSVE